MEDNKHTSMFKRLKNGLSKTRQELSNRLEEIFTNKKVDEQLFEELEELLITSDVGVASTMAIIDNIREKVKKEKIIDFDEIKQALKKEIVYILEADEKESNDDSYPAIYMIVGVNGVGKTTTIGKMAAKLKKENKRVIIVAADTFRAAASEQLEIWSKRAGAEIIKHQEGSDPGAVVYDGIQAAIARKADVIICDTAGRLHNKKNLMEELKKINRIIDRDYNHARKEVYLVVDAATGQNAVSQAQTFKESVGITGVVLTKMDGTAKGGVIIAIKKEIGVPVKMIGVGEGVEDLQVFSPVDFADALFD